LQARTLPILLAVACNIAPGAQAYSLNLTAVPKGPLGYLTAWPSGTARPLASTLNALVPIATANASIVLAGSGGSIDVFASNATDLVIDINGYFALPAAGGLSLYNVAPCRVLDTRLPAGSQPVSGTLDVHVIASPCVIPAAAEAYVVTVTAIPAGGLGYLTLWPQGQSRPLAATLNASDGVIASNLAIVPSANGLISAFPSDPSHLVFDIFGYFAQ
jgi:hypothetical protein